MCIGLKSDLVGSIWISRTQKKILAQYSSEPKLICDFFNQFHFDFNLNFIFQYNSTQCKVSMVWEIESTSLPQTSLSVLMCLLIIIGILEKSSK